MPTKKSASTSPVVHRAPSPAIDVPAIENGIPVPATGRGRRLRFPWDKMEVNQSLFFPVDEKQGSSIYTSAYNFGKRHGGKFASRRVTEGEKTGMRIWKVA